MAKVLIIGAGGVGNVVVQKCAQVPEVFEQIVLASRGLAKCEGIAQRVNHPIKTAQVDADDAKQVVTRIESHKPDMVIN
ncbi:MAG: saccharopine dehydrogenase NADP-binding domain-containing protein [Planctomycetes bacterium]|nr:saccharopine dehydrogenase NADP-binding domain-containing protein [Planctomycetota bacterium]